MQHVFRDPATWDTVTMPVTPGGYRIEQGRKVSVIAMHTVGEISQPGELVVTDQELRYLLPSRNYPFCTPGAVLDPYYYISKLEAWSNAGTVLRYIITDTPINIPVLLGPITHERREDDQSGDLYVTVPIVGCPPLEAVTREDTGNKSRSSEAAQTVKSTPAAAKSTAKSAKIAQSTKIVKPASSGGNFRVWLNPKWDRL